MLTKESREERWLGQFVCRASEAQSSYELFNLFMMFINLEPEPLDDGSYNDFILSVVDTYGDRDAILSELELDRTSPKVIGGGSA